MRQCRRAAADVGAGPSLRTWVRTAVFRPANEKSRSPLCSSGRGSANAVALPSCSQARERRPAGVAQAEQLGTLVEGLAGGIVDRLAEQFVVADGLHAHQLGVASRHQQRDERKARRIGRQERRQQVAFEVVHAQHRSAQRSGQAHNRCPRRSAAHPPARGRACRRSGRSRPSGQSASANTWRTSGKTRRIWSRDANSGTTPP